MLNYEYCRREVARKNRQHFAEGWNRTGRTCHDDNIEAPVRCVKVTGTLSWS